MLLLLPPSEGKTRPDDGPPVHLDSLSYPELATARTRVLERLMKVSAQRGATKLLGVGTSLAEEVAANTELRQAPTAPANAVYTGVLYAAAGLSSLSEVAARRGAAHVRIFSGLWGVLAPHDHIPAYRLSMNAGLTGLPRERAGSGAVKLAAYWKRHLPEVMDPDVSGVVIDCRSAAYAAAWKPSTVHAEHLSVQVVREVAGVRKVVSHNAKHARGVLTHHLLTRPGVVPQSAEEVADACEEMTIDPHVPIHGVELGDLVRGRRTLTLIERG